MNGGAALEGEEVVSGMVNVGALGILPSGDHVLCA